MINKENRFFIMASLFLIFLLFFGMVWGKTKAIINRKQVQNDRGVVMVDWEKSFPFENRGLSSNSGESQAEKNKYNEHLEIMKDGLLKAGKLGNTWISHCYGYDDVTALGMRFVSYLSDPTFYADGFTKLEDGYWIHPETMFVSIPASIDALYNYSVLNEYVKSKNAGFLFCVAPNKECIADADSINWISSNTNNNISNYLSALDQYGIERVDFRTYIHSEGIDHHSLFFKTDNHWNSRAGLWATSIIEEKMAEQGLAIQNAKDFGEYSCITFKDAVFGAAGRIVTHSLENSEDLEMLYPDAETCFRLEVPDKNVDTEGSFEDIIINYNDMDDAMASGGGYGYESVLYGNRPYVKITNLKNKDAPKVLMIRDSFSLMVAPYLALSCSELILIDTRSFTGSILTCIDAFQSDFVLALESYMMPINVN